MSALRQRLSGLRKDERGYTLPELLTTVAILGILLAIAIIILLGLLERWRVDAAAKQLAADLRLAHSNATNQLTDWRTVLAPGRADENLGPDYYLIRLEAPYPATTPSTIDESIPRTLPANVRVVNASGATDNQGEAWWVPPSLPPPNPSRTLEFNTDGTMKWYQAVSGSVCVTVDGDPQRKITVVSATSRVEIKDENETCG